MPSDVDSRRMPLLDAARVQVKTPLLCAAAAAASCCLLYWRKYAPIMVTLRSVLSRVRSVDGKLSCVVGGYRELLLHGRSMCGDREDQRYVCFPRKCCGVTITWVQDRSFPHTHLSVPLSECVLMQLQRRPPQTFLAHLHNKREAVPNRHSNPRFPIPAALPAEAPTPGTHKR